MTIVKRIGRFLIRATALGLGSGLSPWMPGTMGTLLAVVLYSAGLFLLPPLYYVLFTAFFTGVAIVVSDSTARDLGVPDAPQIVIDEIVGFWWTMAFVPPEFIYIVVGFVSFRCFDIVKPWPIGYLDRTVKGGVGIVVDDLVAALYAWVSLQLLQGLLGIAIKAP